MKIPFVRPHMAAAARALRYVAGELRRAELVATQEVPFLLYMMGLPAPRLPVQSPTKRPRFILRPALDRSSWQERDERWLQGVEEVVRPLAAGAETIIAEVSTFYIHDVRRVYTQEKMRAPFLEVGDRQDLFAWFELIPSAILAGGIQAMTDEPATTIVRRFSNGQMPEVPQYQLIICPHWLWRLGWHPHQDNWLLILDRGGEVVARIVWWRDGDPVDVSDDAIWGEGIYVSVTPAGRAQIEAITGSLPIHVNARRGIASGEVDGASESRHASSRD